MFNIETLVKAQTAIFKSENELWAPFKDGLLELQKKSAKITYNLRLTKFAKNNNNETQTENEDIWNQEIELPLKLIKRSDLFYFFPIENSDDFYGIKFSDKKIAKSFIKDFKKVKGIEIISEKKYNQNPDESGFRGFFKLLFGGTSKEPRSRKSSVRIVESQCDTKSKKKKSEDAAYSFFGLFKTKKKSKKPKSKSDKKTKSKKRRKHDSESVDDSECGSKTSRDNEDSDSEIDEKKKSKKKLKKKEKTSSEEDNSRESITSLKKSKNLKKKRSDSENSNNSNDSIRVKTPKEKLKEKEKSKENKTKKKEPKPEIETKKEPIKEQVKHSAKKDQLEPRKPNFLAGIQKFDKNKLKPKNELDQTKENSDSLLKSEMAKRNKYFNDSD